MCGCSYRRRLMSLADARPTRDRVELAPRERLLTPCGFASASNGALAIGRRFAARMEPERKRICVSPPAEPTWELPAFDAFQFPPLASTLRIVTWNVWFDPQHANERMALLFAEALARGTRRDMPSGGGRRARNVDTPTFGPWRGVLHLGQRNWRLRLPHARPSFVECKLPRD